MLQNYRCSVLARVLEVGVTPSRFQRCSSWEAPQPELGLFGPVTFTPGASSLFSAPVRLTAASCERILQGASVPSLSCPFSACRRSRWLVWWELALLTGVWSRVGLQASPHVSHSVGDKASYRLPT